MTRSWSSQPSARPSSRWTRVARRRWVSCARLDGGELSIHGYAGLPDGSEWVRDHVAGDGEQPAALGLTLAERMISAGARDILERAEAMT